MHQLDRAAAPVAARTSSGRRLRRVATFAVAALLLAATLPWLAATPAGAVGDLTIRVFGDTGAGGGIARNGRYEGAEPGINGVTVTVYNADGVLQAANNTDSSGLAVFPVLPDGSYRIEVTNIGFGAANGRVVSVPGSTSPGQDNALVLRETIAGGPRSRDIGLRDLNASGVDLAAPASRRTLVSRVWDDQNANGVQDAAEPGVAGLTLEALSGATVVATATSGPDGTYRFEDTLPTGPGYILRIAGALPAGYVLTARDVSSNQLDQRDSDAFIASGAPQVNIPNGSQGVNTDSLDIGLARGSVAGFLWRDLSADGLYDTGEPFLNGVPVQLVNAADQVVATQVTRPVLNDPNSAAGFYEFASVPLTDTYRVRIAAPQFDVGGPLFGHASSPDATDTGRVFPGDTAGGLVSAGAGYVETAAFPINAASLRNDTRNLGFYAGTVGDFVWHDINRDASPAGESTRGLEGVALFIDDGRGGGTAGDCIRNGSELAAVTDLDGYYRFANLPLDAAYDVVLDASDFAPGGRLEGLGHTTGTSCGPNGLAVRLSSATLTAASPETLGADFGIVRAEVGSFVWEDSNADGVFDIGESGVQNVTVRLMSRGADGVPFNGDDVAVGSRSTGATGLYTITDVISGTYYATFDLSALPAAYAASTVVPAGWSDVSPTAGADLNDVRALVAGRTWRTPTFGVAPGSLNPGVDAALYRPVTIVARVFDERASLPPDNAYAVGDTGITTATVVLTTTSGTVTPLSISPIAATGLVTITVPPIAAATPYWLNVATPAGYIASPGNAGALQVSPNPASGATAPASGAFDFGYFRSGRVTGTVRFDRDADNNLLADGEPGVEGVTVRLLQGAAVITSTTTSAAGDYALVAPPGSYTVELVNPDSANFAFVAGAAGDNDVTSLSGADGRVAAVTVSPAATTAGSSDAALVGQATVSGQVWVDADGDGVRDGGESAGGLPSVTASLTLTVNIPNRLSTTLTRSAGTSGAYSFANLPGGASASEASFDLSFSTPAGWTATTSDAPAATTSTDSDGAGTGADQLDDQALGAGATAGRDRGYYQPVTLVARVFEERTLPVDNAYAAGDTGITTATVVLTTTSGTVTPLNTPTIAADGTITFSVPPVDSATPYWLGVSTPGGFTPSPGNAGARQVSPNPTSGQTAPASGAFDFGYHHPGRVTGTVRFDRDADSDLLVDGEPGVEGVTVRLLDSSDALVSSAATDASGAFSFAGVVPAADYRVEVANPDAANFSVVTTGLGDNDLTTASGADGRTDQFDLSPNAGVTLHAALVGQATVSGQVWVDADGDGVRDGGESAGGLPSVTASLTLTVNIPNRLSTTLTRSAGTSGAYSFANLPGGASASEASFDLSFSTPTGWTATTSDASAATTSTDSDGAGTGADQLDDQALGAGATAGRDRGYYQPVTLVARVFEERTLPVDNAYAAGDTGITTATVVLTTTSGTVTPLNTPTIAADGTITFSVPPVDSATPYWLGVSTPGGFTPSPGNAGARQVSPNPTSGQTAPASGAFDFGYVRPATVSGRAFFDLDNDGAFDTGDPAVQSVAVDIYTLGSDGAFGGIGGAADTLLNSTTTAADGSYGFTGLVPGVAHGVRFVNPLTSDLQYATANQGGDDALDSDVTDLANGRTDAFTPGSSQQITGLDAGYTGTTSVRGTAFVDAAGDGQSAGDTGLPGVRVRISHGFTLAPYVSGTIVAAVTTDANGTYDIGDLPGSGTGAGFTLTFTPTTATPAWILTAADVGADATDSDGELAGQPLAGGTNAVRDQGYYQPVTIVLRAFEERTAPVDSAFAAGDTGIPTATLTLTTTAGAVSPLSTSGPTADGSVTFTVPPTSTTYFANAGPVAGFSRSPNNTGALPVSPSPTSGQRSPAAGAWDFGYYRTAAVAGTAWFDSDGDGQQDAGEPGMEGVQVTLYRDTNATAGDGEAQVGSTVTTSAAGAYAFPSVEPSGVTPGSYRLQFALPSGFAFTTRGAAVSTDANSDPDPAAGAGQGFTGLFTVGSGAAAGYVDAGYLGAGTLGGLVWEDLNADGVLDGGEPALPGATLTITLTTSGINSSNPVLVRTAGPTTSASPNYSFSGLPAGSYVLSVTGRPFGYAYSGSATRSGSATGAVTGQDFGLYRTAAVGNRVWLDLNGNGTYDAASDPGVPGVTVELLNAGTSAVVATTTTAASGDVGSYAFLNVVPGSYRVRFTAPAGMAFVNDGAGSPAADDDNDASLAGLTAAFQVTSGTPTARVDAGLRGTGSVSGIAWQDENGNDVRDAIDTVRVAGVRVTLTLTSPSLASPATVSQDTAADGSYSITGLPAGSYSISFAPPAGFYPVQADSGSDDTVDSEAPSAAGTLAAGQAVTGVDAGYRRSLSIFAPMVYGRPGKSDLVGSFALSTNGQPYTGGQDVLVTVTVTNTGTSPTEAGFWVDLYINPDVVPSAPNVRWDQTCSTDRCRGIAWYVGRSLVPGESVTLTSTAGSYEGDATVWDGKFPAGTRSVYIYVDSWNPTVSYGALDELNENNNLFARTDLQVGAASAAGATGAAPRNLGLPARPAVPQK